MAILQAPIGPLDVDDLRVAPRDTDAVRRGDGDQRNSHGHDMARNGDGEGQLMHDDGQLIKRLPEPAAEAQVFSVKASSSSTSTSSMQLRRQETASLISSSSPTAVSSPSSSRSPSASASSSTAPSSAPTAASSLTTLPSAFDTSFSPSNFTSPSCASYISSFLTSPQFRTCLPFSLLVQSSHSFFLASRSPVLLTQILDVSCGAPRGQCGDWASSIAGNLTTPQLCLADYQLGNPVVVQSLLGMESYGYMLSASCTRNPSTGSYCYVDAITNTSSPTDSYVFSVGLNQSLPTSEGPLGGWSGSCNDCLREVMGLFWTASANRSSPVAGAYAAAAGVVDGRCGAGWVNGTLPAAVSSGAVRGGTGAEGPWGTGLLVVVLFFWMGLF